MSESDPFSLLKTLWKQIHEIQPKTSITVGGTHTMMAYNSIVEMQNCSVIQNHSGILCHILADNTVYMDGKLITSISADNKCQFN